jgi:hypothetical protein
LHLLGLGIDQTKLQSAPIAIASGQEQLERLAKDLALGGFAFLGSPIDGSI